MPPQPKILKALPLITTYFTQHYQRVFTYAEIARILESHSEEWNLPTSTSFNKMTEFLVEKKILFVTKGRFKEGSKYLRYHFHKTPSLFELATSLKSNAYISQVTAAQFFDLLPPHISTVYVTQEQTNRSNSKGILSQEAIDVAFRQAQRRSNITTQIQGHTVLVLNSKNTNFTGLFEIEQDDGRFLISGIERTLLDMTVRPIYSGGAIVVLSCYKKVVERGCDALDLLGMLNELDYTYPYRQAVGFYLEKAGYPAEKLSPFKEGGFRYRFYLEYEMKNPFFNSDWQLYYPADLQ